MSTRADSMNVTIHHDLLSSSGYLTRDDDESTLVITEISTTLRHTNGLSSEMSFEVSWYIDTVRGEREMHTSTLWSLDRVDPGTRATILSDVSDLIESLQHCGFDIDDISEVIA